LVQGNGGKNGSRKKEQPRKKKEKKERLLGLPCRKKGLAREKRVGGKGGYGGEG